MKIHIVNILSVLCDISSSILMLFDLSKNIPLCNWKSNHGISLWDQVSLSWSVLNIGIFKKQQMLIQKINLLHFENGFDHILAVQQTRNSVSRYIEVNVVQTYSKKQQTNQWHFQWIFYISIPVWVPKSLSSKKKKSWYCTIQKSLEITF